MATSTTRMTAEQRRESIVRAAGTVFGRTGYSGTTTEQVARAAGISQPYVVRMFGSKEVLFLEVLDRAEQTLLRTFRLALADHRARGGADADVSEVMGEAYADLVADDGIHLPLMHAFLEGDDPVVGPRARRGFLAVWSFLTEEAGLPPLRAVEFLGAGMLLNVLLGLRMPEDGDERATALVDAACGPRASYIRAHASA